MTSHDPDYDSKPVSATEVEAAAEPCGVQHHSGDAAERQRGTESSSSSRLCSAPALTPVSVFQRSSLPRFLIRGHLDATSCAVTQPLTGELVLESSEVAIKSIELQLVRVETCGCAEGYARDATEIQNIQIAEGDVCRGLSIPIYMPTGTRGVLRTI
ncbi:hypothetical protein cypCar_00047620 [Cyprinus carpio]|nr:hypothetical protein cypCar_00047620 [Cyprinus carpio]